VFAGNRRQQAHFRAAALVDAEHPYPAATPIRAIDPEFIAK
jgi:hypothetical protein